jgi:hypothetical protein
MTFGTDPDSYDAFAAFLEGGRNPNRRPLAGNTTAERKNDAIAVQLHQTDILTFHRDGRIVADSGGWRTMTTAERMNRYLPRPWRQWSESGIWNIGDSRRGLESVVIRKDGSYLLPQARFFDGIELDTVAGGIVWPQGKMAFGELDAANVETRRLVTRYVDGFTPEVAARLLDDWKEGRTAGDCWFCLLRTNTGESMGEAFGDNEHLRGHVSEEETYYMVSLTLNAFRYRGFGDPSTVLSLSLTDPRHGLERIRGTLRKYLLDTLTFGEARHRV